MSDLGGLTWRTSSKSSGGACVAIAIAMDGERVYMRDSKDPAGPVLAFDRAAFRDFIEYITETGFPETSLIDR